MKIHTAWIRWIITGLVFVGVLVGIASYLVSQQNSFKGYISKTSKEGSFQVKYPPTWFLVESDHIEGFPDGQQGLIEDSVHQLVLDRGGYVVRIIARPFVSDLAKQVPINPDNFAIYKHEIFPNTYLARNKTPGKTYEALEGDSNEFGVTTVVRQEDGGYTELNIGGAVYAGKHFILSLTVPANGVTDEATFAEMEKIIESFTFVY